MQLKHIILCGKFEGATKWMREQAKNKERETSNDREI